MTVSMHHVLLFVVRIVARSSYQILFNQSAFTKPLACYPELPQMVCYTPFLLSGGLLVLAGSYWVATRILHTGLLSDSLPLSGNLFLYIVFFFVEKNRSLRSLKYNKSCLAKAIDVPLLQKQFYEMHNWGLKPRLRGLPNSVPSISVLLLSFIQVVCLSAMII